MIRALSKALFYFSSYSILPPSKAEQLEILRLAKGRHSKVPLFLQNSLRQYDCHARYFLPWIWFGFNVFSILAFLPVFLLLVLRSFKAVGVNSVADICLNPKIPFEIRQRFNPQFKRKPFGYLRRRDRLFVLQILKFGYGRPYFLLRSIWKLAVYSELVDTYCPERVWVTQEMVFESSLVTSYVSSFGIKHINYMHGENYFSIQVAFSTFSEFFVWDEYYANLFRSLYVDSGKYEVFSALARTESSFVQGNFLKYYSQDSRSAKRFNRTLDNLEQFSKAKDCELVVRLHPLHKTCHEVKALKARGIKIEENSIDIVDSISEAKFVCSEFSSVLYFASILKRPIVIDNTFQDRIDLIKDLDPIFIKKLPHEYLVTSAEKSRR